MKRPLFALCFPFHWLFCAFLPGFAFFVRSGQSRRDLRSRAFVKRDVTKLVSCVVCLELGLGAGAGGLIKTAETAHFFYAFWVSQVESGQFPGVWS